MSKKLFTCLVAACLGLGGCKKSDLLKKLGDYEGILSLSTDEGGDLPQFVLAKISGTDSNTYKLLLSKNSSSSGGSVDLGTIEIRINNKTIILKSSFEQLPNANFRILNEQCITADNSAKDTQESICLKDNSLSIYASAGHIKTFSLELTQIIAQQNPPMETPKDYSVSELSKYTRDHGFDSLIAFQKSMEARDMATNAYLNLLPHISANDILNLVGFNIASIAKSIGDLVPFLMPDKWLKASEAGEESALASDSLKIVNADGINIAESLAISILRDNLIVQKLTDERQSIEEIRNQIKIKEQAGIIQLGSSDDISSILNEIDQTIFSMNTTKVEELKSLSQAAGFMNPGAVSNVKSGLDNSIEQPIEIDEKTATQIALARAIELQQMDDALALARSTNKERYFTFLDPSGDTNGGIGFGLPSYLSIGKDQVAEVAERKKQMQSLIIGKVSTTLEQINESINNYKLATDAIDIQNRRVARITQNLHLGINFAMSDLVNALEGQVKSELSAITTEYEYYLALSKLNRILYLDSYDGLNVNKE